MRPVILLLSLLAACGRQVCEPLTTQLCVCPGAVASAQTCAEDGEGWGECACGLLEDDDDEDDDVDESVDEGDHTGWTGVVVGDAERGATIYAASCAACHGASGLGGAGGPSLAKEVAGESDEELVETIREGEDDMPPFPNLSEQDLADLIAWLRQRFGGSSEGEEEEEDD